jgi:hypothetical protein
MTYDNFVACTADPNGLVGEMRHIGFCRSNTLLGVYVVRFFRNRRLVSERTYCTVRFVHVVSTDD